MQAALGLGAALVATACAAPAGSQTMNAPAPEARAEVELAQVAWTRVRQAATPEEQANAVHNFLRALPKPGGRSAALDLAARDIASGRAVALGDPSLLQRPQAHEVTVSVAGRNYVFTPLSRASLAPLLRD